MVRKLFACLILVIVLVSLGACSPMPEIKAQYNPQDIKFSGERAYAIEEQFVTTFTGRVSGTEQSRQAAEWLLSEFSSLGWSCEMDTWDTVNYSRPVTYRNVVCRLPGQDPRQILVVAHHDIASTTVQGADNDGSGIAIMLHLAEIFAADETRPYSLVFVATDAEEYGMVGSKRFADTVPDKENIIAGLSLDNLGRDYYDNMIIELSGQFKYSDYGPVWVALVSQEAAKAADGLWQVNIKDPVTQMLEQAVPFSFTDQGPLNAAGIPAIGFGAGYPAEYGDLHYQLWHDPGDSMERQTPVALGQSGALAEVWIRQLMAMDWFPDVWGPYLYFESSRTMLRGIPLYLIFISSVALFFVSAYFVGRRSLAQRLEGWKLALPHYLGLWLPLVAGQLLLYLFVLIGVMDKYELYPSAVKDPAMLIPNWLAIGLYLVGLAIFFIMGRWLVQRFTGASPRPDFGSIKSLAFLIVGLVGVFVVVVNPFALLFFVPLFLWLLIRGKGGLWRVLDWLFFVLGGLMLYALIFYFGFIILRYGIVFMWFFMNAIASQMFGFTTSLAGFAVLAAGLSMVIRPPKSAAPQPEAAPEPLQTKPVGG